MIIRGYAKKDVKTKSLVNRLRQNDIAVISHRDLDEVAALHLTERKVRAVINCAESISGRYPNQGPKILSEAGIPVIDNIGKEVFDKIRENDFIEIIDDSLYLNKEIICKVNILSKEEVARKTELASENLKKILYDFVENTLTYAEKEKQYLLEPVAIPPVNVKIKGKHVLIVVRGKNYKEDLKAIRPYIMDVNPVIIGVDGGADAVLEFGIKPDIIIGDMDSVSDDCLKKCKEIIVHAYPDGTAPGMQRLEALKIDARKFCYPGTSEDIALILAYENKAELIVTVGSHTNMIDFLEKGRKGMASTLLVRMKVGYKVVDAKGVSELYQNRLRPSYILMLMAAAMLPLALVANTSPLIRDLYRLIFLRLRLLFGL